jgi:hypothetical protein
MKNTHSKLILFVFISFAILSLVSGQKKAIEERTDRSIENADYITVNGTVTAFNNYYLKNVEVKAKETRTKVFSDSLGRFEIMLPMNDDLIFKANGFEKYRREVSENEDDVDVDMILMPGEKNEKKAVDYGHMFEEEIAQAVEIPRKNNNDLPLYSDIKQLLQAELLGTRVIDQGNIQVFVRGNYISAKGFSENNGAAIFVLDGMIVRDIDDLNPRDVRYITMVKGHEATRRYGSRGANGAVLINTK